MEPESTRAASLWAGDAPDQELLRGAADPAQPPVVRPARQLLQRAADGRTCYPADTFHVSQQSEKYPKPI